MVNQSGSNCFVGTISIPKINKQELLLLVKKIPKIEFLSDLVVAYKIRLRLVKSEKKSLLSYEFQVGHD